MRKLYTDVSLETPFLVSYNDVQTQACANDEDTITIGAEEFVRLTDANGHNVSDGEGNQLLLNDGIIYKLVSGVPESTNVQVIDVVIPDRYTLTINPTPNDATVTLTATGEVQAGNSITVDDGTTVSYTVEASGYVSQSGTYTVDGADHTENIVLVPVPVPQETVIEYTSSGWSYTTTYTGEGQIPANAYLSFDLVNRPDDTTAIQDYNVDCGFMIDNQGVMYMPYIVHAEGLNYAGSTGYLPIESGIPNDTLGEIGQLAVAGDTYVQECIKKVTLNADNSCEIIVEAVSTGTTRTINVASADNKIVFDDVKFGINSLEGVDALRHFGQYLAFAFVDTQQQSHDNAPVVKLHIPSA